MTIIEAALHRRYFWDGLYEKQGKFAQYSPKDKKQSGRVCTRNAYEIGKAAGTLTSR